MPTPSRVPKQRNRHHQARLGAVGIVLAVVVLSFMMVVSMSILALITTERQAASTSRSAESSYALAQAGILYYMGLLTATDTTFVPGQETKRIHFLSRSDLNDTSVTSPLKQQIGLFTADPGLVFPTVATSAWMFASGTTLFQEDDNHLASSGLFVIKTYVLTASLSESILVKSLGAFRQIEEGSVATLSYSQVVARLKIDPTRRTVSIDRMTRVPIEYPLSETSPFHSSLYDPFK